MQQPKQMIKILADIEYLSVSALDTFSNCPRLYCYQYGHKLEPRGLSLPLYIGSMFGRGLELSLNKQTKKQTITQIKTECKGYIKTHCETPQEQDLAYEEIPRIIAMIKAWRTQNQKMLTVPMRTYTEVPLYMLITVDKHDNTIPIIGFADAVIQTVKRIRIVEFKTRLTLNFESIGKLAMNKQIQFYSEAFATTYDITPYGVIYSANMKTKLRQKQDETRAQYIQRVYADYIENPLKYFLTLKIRYNPHHVTKTLTDIGQIARMLINHAAVYGLTNIDAWPRDENHCYKWAKECPFMPLCKMGLTAQTAKRYNKRTHTDATQTKIKRILCAAKTKGSLSLNDAG